MTFSLDGERQRSTFTLKVKITVKTIVNDARCMISIATLAFAFGILSWNIDEKKGMFGVQRVPQLAG
jgi:hypothetical protein